jgi:uncharacterized protein (TIGR02246 family)
MRYDVVCVVLGASILGCAQPQSAPATKLDEAAARAAITPRLERLSGAIAKKNAAAAADLFTDDATWVLPDASTFKGKSAIQAGAAAFFTSFDSVTTPAQAFDKIIVVSDSEVVAFATAKYTIYMKGKKAQAHVNPYSDLWKKGSDGTWRIAYEVNAEGPATPPAPPAASKKS